jgi:hypothetical protein
MLQLMQGAQARADNSQQLSTMARFAYTSVRGMRAAGLNDEMIRTVESQRSKLQELSISVLQQQEVIVITSDDVRATRDLLRSQKLAFLRHRGALTHVCAFMFDLS